MTPAPDPCPLVSVELRFAAAGCELRGESGSVVGSLRHDNQLEAFAHEVSAQRQKALTDAQADLLIALSGGL